MKRGKQMKWMKKRIIETTGKCIKKNIKQYQSSKCSPKFTYPSRKPRELIGFLITCDYFYLFSFIMKSRLKALDSAL